MGTTLYAAALAERAYPDEPRRVWPAALAALALAWTATRPAPKAEDADSQPRGPAAAAPLEPAGGGGPSRLDPTAYATWGLALATVSLAAHATPQANPVTPWLGAVGTIGCSIAAVAACHASNDAAAGEGMAASLPRAAAGARLLAFFGVVAAVALTLLACAAPRVLGVSETDLAPWTGAVALGAIALVHADRLRAYRLILGVAERARASVGAVAGAAGLVLALLAVRAAPAGPLLRLAAAGAALVACAVAVARDPAKVARVGRRALTLGLFGAPVVLVAVIASEGYAGTGAIATLVGGLVALAVGTLGPWLERPLRPAEGRWLDAIADANAALTRAAPDDGVARALFALRGAAGPGAGSPELWTLDPERVQTIDAAGYGRETADTLHPRILEVAAKEPEATVRAELLDALLVRRPDLRPLARWMDDHGALAATVVSREREACGLLVVPRGTGREPLTLEEARALRGLSEAMAGACAARSALLRSLTREREAAVRAEKAELALDRDERAAALASERRCLEVTRLAQDALLACYSPAMRFAQAELDRKVLARAPLLVSCPVGLDPVPYLAAALSRGPGRSGPLVVVDGAASAEHDRARWVDRASSPLALAQGGLLVLKDGACLPEGVQQIIGHALASRRAPWEEAQPLDVALTVTTVMSSSGLDREGAPLDAALAARLGELQGATVRLPPLAERAEDLRALITGALAREGLRQRGAPMGIEDAAFAVLAEHPFPGDYAELAVLASLLVKTSPKGAKVIRRDVVTGAKASTSPARGQLRSA